MRLDRARLLTLLSALALGSACGDQTNQRAGSQRGKADAEQAAAKPAAPTPAAEAAPLPEVAPPTVDSAAVTAPAGVVATVQLPSGKQLADLGAALDGVKPGSAAQLRAQLPFLLRQVAGLSLDKAADLSAPISIVVLDPAAHPEPFALLVAAADQDELGARAVKAGREIRVRDGLALIGPPAVVSAVEGFAFDQLRAQPDHTELILYLGPLLDALSPQIDQVLTEMGGAMLGTPGVNAQSVELLRKYANAMLAVGRQTQRVVVSVSPGQTTTDLFVRMYPIAGSTFGSFVSAQVPAEHALVAKLPNSANYGMLCSGQIHAGAAMAGLEAFLVEGTAATYNLGLTAADWTALFDPWLATLDGEFAMTMQLSLTPSQGSGGLKLSALLASSDAAAMREAWRAMIGAMTKAAPADGSGTKAMGMGVTTSYEQDALSHDGVGVDVYATRFDLSDMPAEQRASIEAMGAATQAMHFATFDEAGRGFGAMASAAEDAANMRALIDAARGEGEALELSEDLERALASSKAQTESLFFYADVAALAPAELKMPMRAFVLGMGKHGDGLGLRLSMRK
ncbi:hypothetical protein ENSA5_26110 [Enhygromyxa salina]|uniref:DUF3352 domain-containing protein n=1 Tax=Enhygromyxa salina TaxID=215803 RepID=A0A2S9YAR8_9BACT|nr:hypothetical protein [Enhygromyxa salina]PRQ02152.1 hypothetical protein ENSA5_26110 [Enhygromyxa salina]